MMRHALGPVLAIPVLLLATSAGRADDAPDTSVASASLLEVSAQVDVLLAQSWGTAGIVPAQLADDATFFRRASLDLTGVIPSVAAVRQFLADTSADKRARAIDRLCSAPRHATHLANVWRRAMLPGGVDVQQLGGDYGFVAWLQNQFGENVPYDVMVRNLLTAQGNVGEAGPILFYTVLELKPEELAASTSRIFLGVQIQCAQCHKHPFDHWTQEDFWGFAAFFARLSKPQQGQPFAFQVADVAEGEVNLPLSEAVATPQFLGGALSPDAAEVSRRSRLAEWIVARENPYFARATVNRAWAMLFGRGLVEPLDDLGPHNPASQPEVLDLLSNWFVETGFDLRALTRVLANTQAYQRTSESSDGPTPPPEAFAQMAIKSLSGEQLYDCLIEAMRRREQQPAQAYPGAMLYDPQRQAFLLRAAAPGQAATEYQAGIPQALTLLNGGVVAEATDLQRSDLLAAIDAPLFTSKEQIEVLFLSALSRFPRPEEEEALTTYVDSGGVAGSRRAALADVFWALLNSAEFALNH